MPMLHPSDLPTFDRKIRLINNDNLEFKTFNLAMRPQTGVTPARTKAHREKWSALYFYYLFRLRNAAGELLFPIELGDRDEHNIAVYRIDVDGQGFIDVDQTISQFTPQPQIPTLVNTGVLSIADLATAREIILSPYLIADQEKAYDYIDPDIDQRALRPVLNFVPWIETVQPGDRVSIRCSDPRPVPGDSSATPYVRLNFQLQQHGITRLPGAGLWGLDAYRIPIEPRTTGPVRVDAAFQGQALPTEKIRLHSDPQLVFSIGEPVRFDAVKRDIWAAVVEDEAVSGLLFNEAHSDTAEALDSPIEVKTLNEERQYIVRYSFDIKAGSIVQDESSTRWQVTSISELGRKQFMRLTCERVRILSQRPVVEPA